MEGKRATISRFILKISRPVLLTNRQEDSFTIHRNLLLRKDNTPNRGCPKNVWVGIAGSTKLAPTGGKHTKASRATQNVGNKGNISSEDDAATVQIKFLVR